MEERKEKTKTNRQVAANWHLVPQGTNNEEKTTKNATTEATEKQNILVNDEQQVQSNSRDA